MFNVDQLPLEILSLILLHASNRKQCALVNKQFYSVAKPFIWRHPWIRDATLDEFLNILATTPHSLGQHIRELPSSLRWTDAQLLSLMKYVNNLESLNLSNGRKITDESVQYLPQHCPNLKELHLGSMHITHRSMVALGQHCHQLNQLHLSSCTALSANTFSALANCPLEKLVVVEDSFDDDGPHWMTAEDTLMDLTRFDRLTSLSITNPTHKFARRLLTTTTAITSTATIDNDGDTPPWPHLARFFLNNCPDIDDECMVAFLKTHQHIDDLALYGCNLTDTTLNAIASYLPGLTSLDIYYNPGISAKGIRRVVLNCPLLTYMNLEDCSMTSIELPDMFDDDERESVAHGSVEYLDEDDLATIRHNNKKKSNSSNSSSSSSSSSRNHQQASSGQNQRPQRYNLRRR